MREERCRVVKRSGGRRWCALGATLLFAGCSKEAASHVAHDASVDRSAVAVDVSDIAGDVSDIGEDVASSPDAGIDVVTPRDDGRRDVVVVRDAGSRDAGAIVPVDLGPALEVPLDPMGVPAPGSECTGDAGVRPGDPSIAPPRPILPQSVSRVTSQRPSFRWVLPEGTTGARVEVCADRCCVRVIQTLEAEGTTVRPTTALPPGVVYWRMFGRRAGMTGSRASYTWEFEVRRRDTPVDSSWGTIRDFTGDGYDDLLMRADDYNSDGTRSLYVVEGALGGPRPPRLIAQLNVVPYLGRAKVGDFNGDGRADIAYYSSDSEHSVVGVVQSEAAGSHRAFSIGFPRAEQIGMSGPTIVDWDGDGYSDLVATAYSRPVDDFWGSLLLIYRGSPSGLSARPQSIARMSTRLGPLIYIHGSVSDVDSDGYGDIMIAYLAGNGRHLGYSLVFGGEQAAVRSEPLWSTAVPDGLSDGQALLQCVADVDGDGQGDQVVSLLGSPGFYLFRHASGFDVPSSFMLAPPTAGGADFGFIVEPTDLNGDGFADLLVRSSSSATETWGMTGFPFNAGRMYVYFGARDGVFADPIWFDRMRPTDPADNPRAFAATVLSPGDLNGDGFDDAAIGDLSRRACCYVMGSTSPVGSHLGGCLAIPGHGLDLY